MQIRDGRVSAEDGEAVVNRGGWVRIPGGPAQRRLESSRRPRTGRCHPPRAGAAGCAGRLERDAAPGDVVVRTIGLTKLYGDEPVFRDLSLELESGRLSAVTGPSGSGKSTLLHLLAGLDLPTAGEVHVLDAPISQLDATRRALVRREHIGLVTQGTDLVPFLTALESVELALAMRGAPTAGAAATLASVGLEELAQQRVSRLSMGERQRVAVARALAARPGCSSRTNRLHASTRRTHGRSERSSPSSPRRPAPRSCARRTIPVLIEHARAEVPLGTLAA